MPSLYNHEGMVHGYTEYTDQELLTYEQELKTMRQASEIPRQHAQIDRILAHIAFELSYRIQAEISCGAAE